MTTADTTVAVTNEGHEARVSSLSIPAQASDPSDVSLLASIRCGDERAFEALFRRHYAGVYAVAMRVTGNAEEAEEIALDTFLRLYRQPIAQRDDANLRAWLFRVATNAAFNAVRARKRRTGWARRLFGRAEGGSEDPQDIAVARDEAARLRGVLATLPERQRLVLTLRASGLSYAEIAVAADVKPGSVGTLLARAERTLRERYQSQTGADGG
jgi:RNA polymerase sigma-70 factor, ECF subfamily